MANIKKLYVHAGRSKTGTSYLQTILANNAEFLNKNNLHYPDLGSAIDMASKGLPTAGNAIYLASLLTEHGSLPNNVSEKQVEDDLITACKGNDSEHVVISSELFEHLKKPGLQKLQNLAEEVERELCFIQYIRNPVDALESVYAQGVKRHGLTLSPHDYVLNLNMWAINYHNFLNSLKDLKIKFVARIYDKSLFNENRLEVDFFHSLGLKLSFDSAEIITPTAAVNPTPSAYGLRILRDCNKVGSGLAYYDKNTAAVIKVDKELGFKKGVFNQGIKNYIIKNTKANMTTLSSEFDLPEFTYSEEKAVQSNNIDFETYRFLYMQYRMQLA